MLDADRLGRLLPWVLRAAWVGVLLTGGSALDGALTDAGDRAADVTRWVALGWWVVGVAAMAVPAVISLTATRVLVPVSPVIAVLVWIGGASAVDGALVVGLTVVATLVAFAAALGRAFVQASAYGEEDRHLLRAPLPYLLAAITVWVVWVAIAAVAAVAMARGAAVIAAIAGTTTLLGLGFGFPRWHRLARRWLVLVPAGLVIHDHVVLAETLMLRRQEMDRLGLAPAGTDAADLTGPAPGHAVEVRTSEPVTAIVSTMPDMPGGGTIHVSGLLVAPTRPGQLLAAAAARRFPVGPIG